ncbi:MULTISPECIES: DUF480 domain-containing protein [Pseudomonas]|uniref:Uncharacterized protein n=2 Tax=Pseudomonadaceae TaxID=135621 RepID=A0A0D0KW07_9PSED|nr:MULTISPECIES: DUF480 domain-containing protein [Pseudomonas]KIQ02594.1 hypothetical protein RU08_07180 [Pseudomonas fulva]MCW2291602.1 uncharacterized protein YceH (UPF0502 family) [Pseudomonas sp. BIGb0408]NYH73827.1 hypothetical protein [Pseudomonas flavescens]
MSDEPNDVPRPEPLTSAEARVLGCLIEKQATTPEAYPLTLNALVLACNQKTSRDPLMNLTPGAVGQASRSLEERGFARLVMGSRADRWEQRVDKALELVAPQVTLIGLLLLRGPQTVSELLTRSNRLHDFDDADQVQHHLERLIGRDLVSLVGRQPGQREDRYAHLLGDPAELQAQLHERAAQGERSVTGSSADRLEALEARIAELEARLAVLEGNAAV